MPPERGRSSDRNRAHQNFTSDVRQTPVQDYRSPTERTLPDTNRPRQNFAQEMDRLPMQGYQLPPGPEPSDMNRRRQDIRPGADHSPPVHRPTQEPQRGRPPPPTNQDRSRPAPYGSMPGNQSQGGFNSQGERRAPRPRRDESSLQDESYAGGYNAPPARYGSPAGPLPSRPPPQSMSQDDYRNTPYQTGPTQSVPSRNRRSDDMPNFDAIPPRANERPQDHINPAQPSSFDPQVYRKPTYQVPGTFPGQIDMTRSEPPQADYTTSPLAEFSFDLPPGVNARPMTPSGNDAAVEAQFRQQYGKRRNVEMGPPQPQQGATSQYPPREVSRNGMKPPVGGAPPLPGNIPGYGASGQDRAPVRPHTSNAQRPAPQGYDVGNLYDQEYPEYRAPSAPAVSGPYNQAYNPAGASQPYRAPYGQAPLGQAPPPRKPSQDNYNPGGLRPSTSNSAHPVPVRVYPDANASANASVNNVNVNVSAKVNPDALPAHPEPVRQVANNGYATTQPPPVQAVEPAPRQATAPPTPINPSGRNTPPVTVQELNNLRQMYSQNPGDHALGLKLAKRLVEGAKVLSDEGGKADPKQTQKNRERYIFDAHKLVKKLVAANYAEAMFYLADCHGQGLLGLAVDPKEAFHLYQSAAKLNHAQSAYRVAVCCELGSEDGGGTRRDPMKAMQWYKRAATLGDTPAMYKLGMILLKGLLGQPKNPREGVSWLKRAAERADKDNPHALHELGLLYESATPLDHILRDEEYAFQLFQQAAELGYKYSQFRLGSAFEYGLLGCPIDPRQSIAWYTRAAAQGEHQSELALSGWYLTGSPPLLTQSDTEAYLWARKAASSGLAKAEYAMGYFNEVGIGTAVDVEEAKRWYYRAAGE